MYVMILIFMMGDGYAPTRPAIPVVITAEFNTRAACYSAVATLQKTQGAEKAYCLPKGEKQ
jgi:hypothetical protein